MSKFKKGDKILGEHFPALGMFKGQEYTVKSCDKEQMTLEECFCEKTGRHYTFTPNLYEISTKRNYRKMNPNELITISVDDVESDVPLGDVVHAVAVLGVTNGYHGARIWEALRKPFDNGGFVQDHDTVIEFRDKQKEALDYFFQPYYDEQQDKEDLANLISDKQKEVAQLLEKLSKM